MATYVRGLIATIVQRALSQRGVAKKRLRIAGALVILGQLCGYIVETRSGIPEHQPKCHPWGVFARHEPMQPVHYIRPTASLP